jgi:hypothetical protein
MALHKARSPAEVSADDVGATDDVDEAVGADAGAEPELGRNRPMSPTTSAATAITAATSASHENRGRCGGPPTGC